MYCQPLLSDAVQFMNCLLPAAEELPIEEAHLLVAQEAMALAAHSEPTVLSAWLERTCCPVAHATLALAASCRDRPQGCAA